MSWYHVMRRDLTSVFRARTGASILTFTLLLMLLPTWFVYTPDSQGAFLVLLTLTSVGLMLVLGVLGKPRLVTVTAAILAGALMLVTVGYSESPMRSRDTVSMLIMMIGAGLSFLVPLLALLGSYGALVGERATGSVRFLLGLPNSRQDAYLGKFLSRSGVVLLAVLLGIGLVGLVLLTALGPTAFTRLIGLGILTIPYVVGFVGIGLTASAYADTETHAVAIVIGVFALLRAGWPAIQWLLVERPPGGRPRETVAYFWVGRINPINAYVKGTTFLIERTSRGAHPLLTRSNEGIAPVAQSGAFALVVVVAWAVVTPVIGYWIFQARDLL